MRFIPDHRVDFELVEDVKYEIPSIINSPIEFKEGMVFTLKHPFVEKDGVEEVKLIVTGVDITLLDYVDGEIHTKVYCKKV
jgi:hypothetical protein